MMIKEIVVRKAVELESMLGWILHVCNEEIAEFIYHIIKNSQKEGEIHQG